MEVINRKDQENRVDTVVIDEVKDETPAAATEASATTTPEAPKLPTYPMYPKLLPLKKQHQPKPYKKSKVR
jgi:hypothetical protein